MQTCTYKLPDEDYFGEKGEFDKVFLREMFEELIAERYLLKYKIRKENRMPPREKPRYQIFNRKLEKFMTSRALVAYACDPATQESENMSIKVQSQPRQIVHEILS
jgi:hypothetical protein